VIVLCAWCRQMWRRDAADPAAAWMAVGTSPIPDDGALSHGMCPRCFKRMEEEEIEPRRQQRAAEVGGSKVGECQANHHQ
jgi:hypothetical protein